MEFQKPISTETEYDNKTYHYRVPAEGNYNSTTSITRTYPTGIFKDVPTGKAWFKPWTWHWPVTTQQEVMESETIHFNSGTVKCKDGQRIAIRLEMLGDDQ